MSSVEGLRWYYFLKRQERQLWPIGHTVFTPRGLCVATLRELAPTIADACTHAPAPCIDGEVLSALSLALSLTLCPLPLTLTSHGCAAVANHLSRAPRCHGRAAKLPWPWRAHSLSSLQPPPCHAASSHLLPPSPPHGEPPGRRCRLLVARLLLALQPAKLG